MKRDSSGPSGPEQSSPHEAYVSPLVSRWATREMSENFGDLNRFRTWRRLWAALAEAERRLGLDISDEQLAEMRAAVDDIDLDRAGEIEREVRHDVMAHVRTFGEQCPKAKGIIHLGATSCYVTDNAELILIRNGLAILRRKLVGVIDALARFAEEYRNLPCLGLTHFQPAQLTTVGKRASLWLQDFVLDLDDLERRLTELPFRGIKGTTGTQASFMRLFDGDADRVKELDLLVAEAMGFSRILRVSGQTYPRKIDSRVLEPLSGIAQSAHKFANDVRLLQGLGELEEPFADKQVGSSAMPWKRNPMRCERMTGLARFVICNVQNAALTAAEQWFERTLDDSSNRRLSIAESFLAADAILAIALNVANGLVVHPAVIGKRLGEEFPFMVSEAILMDAVRAGGDRQELHERIRGHSMAASRGMKDEGKPCDLLERIAADPAFAAVRDHISELTRPEDFVGRAPQQVEEFIAGVIEPIRERHKSDLGAESELRV